MNSKGVTPNKGAKWEGVGKICDFQPISRCISVTASLSWKRLQITMGMLPITTSTHDELFRHIKSNDFERPWTSKIRCFIDFCDLRLQRTLQEWTATEWLDINWRFASGNCYRLSRFSSNFLFIIMIHYCNDFFLMKPTLHICRLHLWCYHGKHLSKSRIYQFFSHRGVFWAAFILFPLVKWLPHRIFVWNWPLVLIFRVGILDVKMDTRLTLRICGGMWSRFRTNACWGSHMYPRGTPKSCTCPCKMKTNIICFSFR